MWTQIQTNRRNCYLVVIAIFAFMVISCGFAGILYSYFSGGNTDIPLTEYIKLYNFVSWTEALLTGVFISFLIWLLLLFVALSGGKKIILAMNRAYKLSPHTNRILQDIVEEMSIAAGLPKVPEIYVIDAAMPNAFSTGISPKDAAVIVTTGLLITLDRDELQAVIAHEIAHITNRDTSFMLIAGAMLGTITIITHFGLRIMFSRGYALSRRNPVANNFKLKILICSAALLFMVLSPFLARILYLFISQKKEYLADACAVQYTRYPHALATALAKISTSVFVLRDTDRLTSAMYIVHPLDLEIEQKEFYSMFGNFFKTHPPTEKRIEVLEKMTCADFNAYNRAFSETSKKRRTIMNKKDLYNVKRLEIVKPERNWETDVNGKRIFIASALEDIAEKKRAEENTLLKKQKYIFRECGCGTKLKIPFSYKGQEISCPHCKKTFTAED